MPAERQPTMPALQEHIQGRVSIYANPDYNLEQALGDLVDLPGILARLEGRPTRIADRVTSWHWHPRWGPDSGLHVRQYAHGGALGRYLGTVFLGEQRMLDELRLSMHAQRSGVPTAAPFAVRIERVYGPFVSAYYVCASIPEAVNLLDYCLDAGPNLAKRPKVRAEITEAVARSCAAMHDTGILHADLNLKNILVRPVGWPIQAFVIDFDKSRLLGSLTPTQRISNLLRLERSFRKWPSSSPFATSSNCVRFARHYASNCRASLNWRSFVIRD